MTFATDKAAVEARATTLLAQADTYLSALSALASDEIVTGTTSLPESYDYASVPQVDFPITAATRGVIDVGALPSAPQAPVTSFSALSTVSMPVDDLLAPTTIFSFAEAAYESTLINPLKVVLLNNLLNGGYGIETADEIALFNRSRDREVETMMSRVADAGRAMASRGFPLPPGELSVHVDRAYQEMQNKMSDVSRDITLARTKLYVENRQFTIKEIREIEVVLRNYWNSLQERTLNVAKFTAEFGMVIYNTLLKRYELRLNASKITADVNAQIAQVDVARATAAWEIFRSQIAGFEATLKSVIEPAKLKAEVFRADVDWARVVNDGTIARAQLQQEVIKSTTQQNIQISNMTIENAKARILGTIEELRFRTEAAKFGATNFFAQLNAILSSINVLTVESTTA